VDREGQRRADREQPDHRQARLSLTQRGNGIQLYNTRGAQIIGNNVSFVRDAIYVDVSHDAVFRHNRLHHSRYGTHYMNSYHNLWEDNDVYMNRGGLALMEVRDQVVATTGSGPIPITASCCARSRTPVVENNTVAGNARGFFIYDAEYNDPARQPGGGQHRRHARVGRLQEQRGRTQRFHQPIANRCATSLRATNCGVSRKGNHWSNYLGWDRNGDGIGDVPYEANDMVDRLTWRHPDDETAARQSRGADAAAGGSAVSAAARAEHRGSRIRACAPERELERLAWQALPGTR
jgi:nitrous oxidase accessory protein